MRTVMLLSLLSSCTPKANGGAMSSTQVMSEIEAVLSKFEFMLVKNQCVAVYAEFKENGGCYLSRAPRDETALQIAEALVKAGFKQQRSLRLDFGSWTTVLDKGNFGISYTVHSLATDPDSSADYQAGYKTKLTIALTDTREQ
ncbi:hypothetical protein E7T06_12555 [Deinococcus sp. Arct2-2]|uniref:hypothetical protein n=1 Tax=Deinococcus sp. Arct2-2 TaxID=2568653 RepID=UPI0010A4CFFF|nr:hypothetical protein [Deinococcus sp. Arct2-2]THF69315.1 hypothetical protein E7T06_12555 [Deinococcus sp. Arct2-2]